MDTCPSLQDLGFRDKTRDFRIRFSLNVFRRKFSTLLSSFPPCNLVEHSRSSLEGFLFIRVLASTVVS